MAEKRKVLIIDDDEFTLDIYSTLLTKQDCAIVLAREGRLGLSLARQCRPAAIILDLVLPEVGGLDVLRELKGTPETCDIPVFVLTNLASDECQKTAKELGAEQYIIKTDMKPSEVWRCVAASSRMSRS